MCEYNKWSDSQYTYNTIWAGTELALTNKKIINPE